MKDRLYHPIAFLEGMLNNWAVETTQYRLTAQLLSHVRRLDLPSIELFWKTHENDNLGSAFYSVICFSQEFTARYKNKIFAEMILESLQQGRLAITEDLAANNLTVLNRRDGGSAVAFLATIGRPETIIFPLAEGKNLVGRNQFSGPSGGFPKPYVIEQYQFFINCFEGHAHIWDPSSTNLSVLLPSAVALQKDFRKEQDFLNLTGAFEIPHPNASHDRYKFTLAEGDILQGYYASFIFSWI